MDKKRAGVALVAGASGFWLAGLFFGAAIKHSPPPQPPPIRYEITGSAPVVSRASTLRVNLPSCRQTLIVAASDAIDVTRHGCLLHVRGDYAGEARIQIVAFDSKGRAIGGGLYEARIRP